MAVEFPLGTKVISLGRVVDPVVPLLLRTRHGYLPFDFLVDTGADCSMIPAVIAETELGIDLARCPQDVFFGIEGGGVRVFRGWISLKIRTLLSSSYRTTLANHIVWNGKNSPGVVVPAGVYTYKVWV